jgi:hypothetical protein
VYSLQAVITTEQVLGSLADTVKALRTVPLGQGLALLLMTDELFDAVTIGSAPRPTGFWKMPSGFDLTLAAWSAHGPIAYVEADFLGGTRRITRTGLGRRCSGPRATAPSSDRAVPRDGQPLLASAAPPRSSQRRSL